MSFNDLLTKAGIELNHVVALRHTPHERQLKKVLPWPAGAKPDVFNAYQQTQQNPVVEDAVYRAKFVASFIGLPEVRAVFVGLYKVGGHQPLIYDEYWNVPTYQEMKRFGIRGFVKDQRPSVLWFDMDINDFCKDLQGKLVGDWPPPPIRWWRWAHKAKFPIHAVLDDSVLH